MNIKPTGDKVLVKIDAPVDKIGNIYIPDTAKEEPVNATVTAVGEGKLSKTGGRIPMTVKPNDRVLINKYAGFELLNEKYVIIPEADIIAIID